MGRFVSSLGSSGENSFSASRIFQKSGVFKVPNGVKRIRVSCIGAGSGGLAEFWNSSFGATLCFGGSGGGFAQKTIDVSSGEEYVVTVGAGGLGMWISSNTGGQVTQAATSGGDTSFGGVLSATGGQVGTYGAGASFGAPGVGIGGDITASGGRSGILLDTVINGMPYHALGGGAAGTIYGDGGNGGDLFSINCTVGATGRVIQAATGGGGVGLGHGGGIGGYQSGTALISASGGGGASADAPVGFSSSAPASGDKSLGGVQMPLSGETYLISISHPSPIVGLYGSGGEVVVDSNLNWYPSATAPGRGGARSGAILKSVILQYTPPPSGPFAGGGGCLCVASAGTVMIYGGKGGIGAGGGGASIDNGTGRDARGGNGGDGLVVVEY